jgi:hypothetical protein
MVDELGLLVLPVGPMFGYLTVAGSSSRSIVASAMATILFRFVGAIKQSGLSNLCVIVVNLESWKQSSASACDFRPWSLTGQQSDVASQATRQRHMSFSTHEPSTTLKTCTSQLPPYINSEHSYLRTEPKIWAPLFHVSMADNVLDTKLHTHFAIFLYALRLETAMLTKRVYLDAADAERSVKSLGEYLPHYYSIPSPYFQSSILTYNQPTEACRTTSSTITIREGGRACWNTNQVQLCMGRYYLDI